MQTQTRSYVEAPPHVHLDEGTHMHVWVCTHTHAQELSPAWSMGIRVVGTLLPALGSLRTTRPPWGRWLHQ